MSYFYKLWMEIHHGPREKVSWSNVWNFLVQNLEHAARRGKGFDSFHFKFEGGFQSRGCLQ